MWGWVECTSSLMFREGGVEEGNEREREEKEEKGERRKRETERHKQMSGDRRR